MTLQATDYVCSFCIRESAPNRRLLVAVGAAICEECVANYTTVLGENLDHLVVDEADSEAQRETLDRVSDDQLLIALVSAERVKEQADRYQRDTVRALRDRRFTWTRIGEQMGTSKQAAWARFADEE